MPAILSAARPKLSLVVPTVTSCTPTITTAVARTPSFSLPAAAPSSPLTPTARNTQFNARGLVSSNGNGALVNAAQRAPKKARHVKNVSFSNIEFVTLISPLPQDCYGDYPRMSRDERRWAPRV